MDILSAILGKNEVEFLLGFVFGCVFGFGCAWWFLRQLIKESKEVFRLVKNMRYDLIEDKERLKREIAEFEIKQAQREVLGKN